MTNYKDYTIKAKVSDTETIERLLTQMNANYVGLDIQTDFYFETEKGKLKYRQGTIENLITHYERAIISGVERTIVYRYDKNPTIDQIEKLRKGQKQIGVTKKERKIYRIDNIKIHLDKLPDGQRFIEIEASDLTNQFTDTDLMIQCLRIKSKLLIRDNDLVKTGYLASE